MVGRTRPVLIVTVIMAAMMLMTLPVAAKGKPDKPPKPTTTTTTEAPVGAPSCYERVREMGATGWAYDPVTEGDTQWNGTAYVQSRIPACIDLDQPGHTAAMTWEVTWGGGSTARPIKGLKLVFEQGVHGTLYAEHESSSASGVWTVSIDPGGAEPLALVAMPRAGDKWTSAPTFTVRPVEN
jgi:hypothetical protein